MSFFDFVNPFRKKDEFGLPPLEGNAGLGPLDTGMQAEPQHNVNPGDYGTESQFSFQQPSAGQAGYSEPRGFQHEQPQDDARMKMPLGESVRASRYTDEPADDYHRGDYNPLKKELELISSKLDYLKASIEAVNQRLVNLEHLARQEMERKKW